MGVCVHPFVRAPQEKFMVPSFVRPTAVAGLLGLAAVLSGCVAVPYDGYGGYSSGYSGGYYGYGSYGYSEPATVYSAPTYIYTPPAYRYRAPAYRGGRGGWGDQDRDGIPNRRDRDRDGDGIPNRLDRDRDGDGIPNRFDRGPNRPRMR
jgi:hypothetical protein